jgi:hypothetical protein
VDPLRLVQPPQKVEPQQGSLRPTGRGGVGAAFAEVLARAVARREPVFVGAEMRAKLDKAGVDWTPELEGRMGEAMGRFVQRGNNRGLVVHEQRAFVLSVPERELIEVVSHDDLGTTVIDDIDAFALLAKDL